MDLGTEASKAIAANQANLPAAEKLVGAANLFSQQQIEQMLTSVIPNYKQITQSISGNIASEVAGEIPQDVQNAVWSSAAAKSFGSGFAGSGAAKNLVARDLGLTSLAMTDRGLKSAESWMAEQANIYEPSMMRVGSMFVSPGQQASFDVEERNAQFQRQWLQNQIAAAPDPVTVGLWNTSWSVVDAVLSAYTGSNVDLGRVNPQGQFANYGGGGGGMGGGGSNLNTGQFEGESMGGGGWGMEG